MDKYDIVKNWLPRYTGTPLKDFGKYILLTNFAYYVKLFASKFDVELKGLDSPMQSATYKDLSIINFGMGSPNAATIMDLLTAIPVKGVLFIGKCGGVKSSTEIGHFILPIGAIRGEGTSDDYVPKDVPALPSFKLHKFVSEKILEYNMEYRTGVIYSTNRRVWEHDQVFRQKLADRKVIAVDMETATIFAVGHANGISRGALLLVSDMPLYPNGIKTEESDKMVKEKYLLLIKILELSI